MRKMSVLLILSLSLLAACGKPGELPYSTSEIPDKGIRYLDSQGRERLRKIEAACYVDVSKYNPLNAADYILKDSGIQFFDYVILGDSYIKRTPGAPYLVLSEDLQKLFFRRNKVLGPLQKKGIRVLLGVTGGGEKVTFGSLNIDEMLVFARTVYQTLEIYGLDGVAFYDSGADSAAYPHEADYNPANTEGLSKEEWLLEQWKKGGNNTNNLHFVLRQHFDIVPNRRVIFMRESNFACYLPQMIAYSPNGSDFAGTSSQLTYTINSRFDQFIANSLPRLNYKVTDTPDDTPVDSPRIIQNYQYGPLAIDLDGGAEKNAFYPYLEIPANTFTPGVDNSRLGHEFTWPITEFKNGTYRIIYYHNLKALSEAKDDDFYRWLHYRDSLPTSSEFTDDRGYITSNPKYIPLQYLFDTLAKTVFNENILCTGGDYRKDW